MPELKGYVVRSWKPRERMLAGTAVTAVVAALLVEGVFLPQWSRYTKLRDEASRMETSLARMRANMRRKDQIEARYGQLKGLIRESGTASQEMSRFAALLTDLYKPLRLQARSVRPLPDEDLGFYRKFTLSLEVEGPMSELAKLLAVAARASDPIRIERMELNCKDRPDFVMAQLVVTKVATTSRPAADSPRAAKVKVAYGRDGRRGAS